MMNNAAAAPMLAKKARKKVKNSAENPSNAKDVAGIDPAKQTMPKKPMMIASILFLLKRVDVTLANIFWRFHGA